ncbi:hypothetical protein COBT_001255 [Conglomerata obtusa]
MEEDEIYAVDINQAGTMIAYGGKSDTLFISHFPTLKILYKLDDFEDSIIFIKFLQNNTLIVASLEGIICLYTVEDENITEHSRIDIEEDISKIKMIGESLYVGTVNGSIHVFKENLDDEYMLVGHNSEIKEIIVKGNKIFTLGRNKMIIFDAETQALLYKRIAVDSVSMSLSEDGNLFYISGEFDSYIAKEEIVLNRYNFCSECVTFTGDYFICGGNGFALNLINVKNGCKNESMKFVAEDIEGIGEIIDLGHYIIAFSTFCGKIGLGDYRNPQSFRFYDALVGLIFDFKFYYRHIIVCGSYGINVIYL